VTARESGPGPIWYAFLLAGVAGDAITFKTVVAILMPAQAESEAWILTAAFTLTSIGLMHAAGVSLRRGRRPAGSLLVASWVALGAGAFWVRLTQAPPADFALSLDLQATAPPVSQLPSALLFVTLYLASGVLAAWMACHRGPGRLRPLLDARRERLRPRRELRQEHRLQTLTEVYEARRRRRRWLREVPGRLVATLSRRMADRRVAVAQHRHAEAAITVATLRSRLDEVRDEQARAAELTAGEAAQLKHESRLELAVHRGDPAATSALTSTTLPDPARPVREEG
jgi:hypothetical protein